MLSLLVGSATSGARTYEAGGFVGAVLASTLTAYLNRTGAAIVLLTLLCLAAVLTTQVSFGRLFTHGIELAGTTGLAARGRVLAWLDERRRMKQRRDVLAKHAAREGTPPADAAAPRPKAVESHRPAAAHARRRARDENDRRAADAPGRGEASGAQAGHSGGAVPAAR